VRCNLIAEVWRDKQDVHILTNMHRPLAEDNFYAEHGEAHNPIFIEDYDRHMGYLNLGDRMADSYLISQKT